MRPEYVARFQITTYKDTKTPQGVKDNNTVQWVVGKILYYNISIDSTGLAYLFLLGAT